MILRDLYPSAAQNYTLRAVRSDFGAGERGSHFVEFFLIFGLKLKSDFGEIRLMIHEMVFKCVVGYIARETK